MKYCKKIFEKSFSNEVSKVAYLEACKWLAIHVYNKVELVKFLSVNIEKSVERNQLPTFNVTLYAMIDATETDKSFCKKCKSLYTIFYSVDKMNCEECKKHAYCLELEKQIKSIEEYLKEKFEEND